LKILDILNNVFRPQKTLMKTRINLYNTLALPVLLFGGETWTIKARDSRRITAPEIKYTRRTAKYIWTDYIRTYLLTPCSRVLLEKLTGLQLVKKFPAFYGTRRFITALTSARHLSLS
jgi:hypothetical protein